MYYLGFRKVNHVNVNIQHQLVRSEHARCTTRWVVHNKWNTGSHAAPNGGRRVLSITHNPDAVHSHKANTLLLALHSKKQTKTKSQRSAVGFTFGYKKQEFCWPILILPVGQIQHARGCWLVLGGFYVRSGDCDGIPRDHARHATGAHGLPWEFE